jgi:hypothetical protein
LGLHHRPSNAPDLTIRGAFFVSTFLASFKFFKMATAQKTPAAGKSKAGGARPGAGRKKGLPDRATPDEKAAFATIAKKHAPKALTQLAKIAEKGESESARVAACKEILDRAYGRAPQSHDLSGDVSITIVSTVPRAQ